MDTLTATETEIIRSMLVRKYGPASPFLEQLKNARIAGRRLTGVGVFIDFALCAEAERGGQINAEISQAYRTVLSPPRDVVGFTLFIRDGRLDFLEGYTFGDADWPDEPMDTWLLLAPAGEPQPSD